MTFLCRNLILRAINACLRVLNVDLLRKEVALLDLNKPASWPFLCPIEVIEQDVAVSNFVCEDEEPPEVILDSDRPSSRIEHRNAAFGVIQAFVENHSIAYLPEARRAFVKDVCERGEVSRTTVNKYLRLYWRGGMNPNALLPNFGNCGGPGVERKPLEAKRGRPRKDGGKPGPNTTPEMRRYFTIAVNLYYKKDKKYDLTHAYTQCIARFFCVRKLLPDGSPRLECKEEYKETGFPSFKTFEYYVKKDLCYQALQKARLGVSAYEMRYRTKLNSSIANIWGPGGRYEIDATIVDVALRSRRNGPHGRAYVLGSPVLYVVIDTFSKMIVGIYVGWENASWRAAMMAIVNVFEDKVEFCKQLGIDISPGQWPTGDMPTFILGDRAEMMAAATRAMIETLNIGVESTPPYRGDWKGTVESRFHILQSGFRPLVPGSWDRSRQVRGDRDPRLDAVLDIEEFYRVIVELVLYYNNFHILRDYRRAAEMNEANVPSIPLHIWNWGRPALAGAAKTPHVDKVKFALLWRGEASINSEGIRFRQVRYSCDDPYLLNWFKINGRHVSKAEIAFDDRNMNVVWLNISSLMKDHIVRKSRESAGLPNGWVTCTLSVAKGDYLNLTERELEGVLKDESEINEGNRESQILKRAEMHARVEKVVQTARTEVEALPKQSNKATLESMRENRAEERRERRREESDAFTAPFRSKPGEKTRCNRRVPMDDETDADLPPMDVSDWVDGHEQ